MLPRPKQNPGTLLTSLQEFGLTSSADTQVTGVSLSSDRVQPGDLFVALPGLKTHGITYAAAAIANGAKAVLTDLAGGQHNLAVPVLVASDPRAILGKISAEIYQQPSQKLQLVGVTGTQGKTTTTRILEHICCRVLGKAASIGTVGTQVCGAGIKTELTTPEAPDLQGLLAMLVEAEVAQVSLEVSSHALRLGRVQGCQFQAVGFANLGRDHLDFHPNMEDYFAAKAALFTSEYAQRGVVNLDDPYGQRLVADSKLDLVTFSGTGLPTADWQIQQQISTGSGSKFTLVRRGESYPVELPLPGEFNVQNTVLALLLASQIGIAMETAIAAVADVVAVPGRMESVQLGQDFLALVDYAHKPDALKAVLLSARKLTSGRIILVFGAGGDRDSGKRAIMGAIAAEFADVVIVTDDNPRSEDPSLIRNQILAPLTAHPAVLECADRAQAINLAVRSAHPGDLVLVAGKGHETGQEISGVVHDFDDRVQLRKAIQELTID